MLDALKKLFEHGSTSQSIALRTQLHIIKMTRSEIVASYFTRVTELGDQLGTLVRRFFTELSIHILRGFSDSWESFVQSVSGCSKSTKLDKLLAICIEEETRLTAKRVSPVDES